jgi:hypothetical protein
METFGNPQSSFTKPVTASWKHGNPAERTIAHSVYIVLFAAACCLPKEANNIDEQCLFVSLVV